MSIVSKDQLTKLNALVKPSLSLIKVFKFSSDKLFPSPLASSQLLLVILILLITTYSPWMLVAVLLLTDFTTHGIFSLLPCTWLIILNFKVRFRCISTWLILMSVVVTIMLLRFQLEVLKTNNSLKKFQSTSLHAMNLVWYSITAHTKMEQPTKLSLVNEQHPHDWACIFVVPFRNLLVFKIRNSRILI